YRGERLVSDDGLPDGVGVKPAEDGPDDRHVEVIGVVADEREALLCEVGQGPAQPLPILHELRFHPAVVAPPVEPDAPAAGVGLDIEDGATVELEREALRWRLEGGGRAHEPTAFPENSNLARAQASSKSAAVNQYGSPRSSR